MVSAEKCILMVIDVQGKLAQLMHQRDSLFRNLQILIQGAQILGVPILWLEQNPAGLGPTVPEIGSLLSGQKPFSKTTFSGCGSPEVSEALEASGRRQVILAGIEAHVCIYLTAADLLAQNYRVEIVADAVSSRSLEKKQIGLAKIAALSAEISCTETVLFELLGRADGTRFKNVLKLLK